MRQAYLFHGLLDLPLRRLIGLGLWFDDGVVGMMNFQRAIEKHNAVVSQRLRHRRHVRKLDKGESSGLSLFAGHSNEFHFANLVKKLKRQGQSGRHAQFNIRYRLQKLSPRGVRD